MERRSGAPGQGDGHLEKASKEITSLQNEHREITRERERLYGYRDNYLKKRPKKLIKFDDEDYYETPREYLRGLDRYREASQSPEVRAEAEEIIADPDWIYLNETDKRLQDELMRIEAAIRDREQLFGYGKPRMRGGMRGHGMSHMDRGRMWQEMCNRRY